MNRFGSEADVSVISNEADAPEMTGPVVAAMFDEFARWIDRELAAHTSPRKVAQAAADLARDYAREARGEVTGS